MSDDYRKLPDTFHNIQFQWTSRMVREQALFQHCFLPSHSSPNSVTNLCLWLLNCPDPSSMHECKSNARESVGITGVVSFLEQH